MDLLTQPETAEVTRLSERTLERHRLAGTGPAFVRLGRRVFYRREDLEAWIADCTHRSTCEADVKYTRSTHDRLASAKAEAAIVDPSARSTQINQKAPLPRTTKTPPQIWPTGLE